MFSFKSVYFVVFALLCLLAQAEISDKRLCIDENCSEQIAVGKTLIRYSSLEENVLSFGPNEDVRIFSYGAGKRPDLIGVELKGQRGYVNKEHIRETKLIKRPKLTVDTELVQNVSKVPLASDIKADPTQEPFQIVDGTRIPLDLSTEAPLQDTASLNNENENLNQQTPFTPTVVNLPSSGANKFEETQQNGLSSNLNSAEDEKETKPSEYIDEDADNEDDDDEEETVEEEEDDEEEENDDKNLEKTADNKEAEAVKETEKATNSDLVKIVAEIEPKSSATDSVTVNKDAKETDAESVKKMENITESVENVAKTESKSSETNSPEPIVNSILASVSSDSQNITDPVSGEPQNAIKESESQTDKKEELSITEANTTEIVPEKELTEETASSLPEATTQSFIELEVMAPVDISDVVTSNPINEEKSSENLEEPVTPSSGLFSGLSGLFSAVIKENELKTEEQQVSVEEINKASTEVHSQFSGEEISQVSADEVKVNTGDSLNDKQSEIKTEDEIKANILEEKSVIESNNVDVKEEPSSFMGFTSFFGGDSNNDKTEKEHIIFPNNVNEAAEKLLNVEGEESTKEVFEENLKKDTWSSNVITEPEFCDSNSEKCPQITQQGFCDKENKDCLTSQENTSHQQEKLTLTSVDLQELFIEAFSSDMFLYLSTTSLSVLILIFVWIFVDKCRREGPLIARINKLEQQLLATSKENQMLQERKELLVEEKTKVVVETVPNEVVEELNAKLSEMSREKLALEEQIQALEKELDTSTEVGIELNKLISEMLSSTDGSEILKENIEQMQKKVLEQQDIINDLNKALSIKETESYELRLEMEISGKKMQDLQGEVHNMVQKILKIEEERDQQLKLLENEITVYQNKYKEALTQEHALKNEIVALNQQLAELQRTADMKIKEYKTLKETLSKIKSVKDDKEAMKSFLDVSEIKAQLEQMKSENLKYSEQLTQERSKNATYTQQLQNFSIELKDLRDKYEIADKEKVEVNTKLEVLNNYFKEKEDQMQKEISKYESLWAAKEGEATSTTERFKYMQEELQNYKSQNESLKQEIISQEVELKSQISVLEKKCHENWVTNRQTERKLEEAKQEAALLRNRLTMTETSNQMRIQSPLHQNGDLPISPPPLDPTQSPPLFNPRDHITKSPPMPGMPPPPFLPPPLGVTPFLPPPPLEGMMPLDISGMPPFMPLPGMFPGDHRPPPLGRMSSPTPGGRYTPESIGYSEYDERYDSEYGASPPPIRGYSPYGDRRSYNKPQARSNGRNLKGIHSSGSENDAVVNSTKKGSQRKV